MIDVVWFSENPDAISRGYWDQGFLEAIFDRSLWRVPCPYEFVHRSHVDQVAGDGAVVIVPARWHADRADRVQKAIAGLGWCLLVLTGDEEGEFPRGELRHPRMKVWVQTPMEPVLEGERYVGDMCPPEAAEILSSTSGEKDGDWFFSGQVNTPQRRALVKNVKNLPGGDVIVTPGFGAGLDYADFLERLARCRVALCPGGPFTPDTFRLFEALEAGCVPVVDASRYWLQVFGEDFWLPCVAEWKDAVPAIEQALRSWPDSATRASAWFQRYKRDLAHRFYEDLRFLRGKQPAPKETADRITVLVATSSSPGDPSTEIIEETLDSVQRRLPGCETIVMMDGLHADHAGRADRYAEYRRRVAWLCEHRWSNAYPLFFPEHRHQAAMTREALGSVDTGLVLFVEHDAPLVGDVPWADLAGALEGGSIDLIRLHHETRIQPEHEYLMLDREPENVAGVPLRRTVQWSQRPHLATTAFYRRILEQHFSADARTMIEDVMYGVVHTEWREYGLAGADRYRLAMYTPNGNIQRSVHLDARGDEPKVPMTDGGREL